MTNPTVANYYLNTVQQSLIGADFEPEIIEIPDGEEYKSLKWAGKIFDKLIKYKMDRLSPIVALGGGVVGDIAGFVAATYLRGVPYVQVPTTLLAQVDSSVGGKTAVNHRRGKNLIGAFYQPKFVLIDVSTLRSLNMREIRSGLAEVVKYGVIKSEKLFAYLEENMEKIIALEDAPLREIIKKSCEIKAGIVEKDEREGGCRALLNFGHTLGHAVEAVTQYREFKHGEAVALGMLFAANMSSEFGYADESVKNRIESLLKKMALPTKLPSREMRVYAQAMGVDKKLLGDTLNFVFAETIGRASIKKIPLSRCEDYLVKYASAAS